MSKYHLHNCGFNGCMIFHQTDVSYLSHSAMPGGCTWLRGDGRMSPRARGCLGDEGSRVSVAPAGPHLAKMEWHTLLGGSRRILLKQASPSDPQGQGSQQGSAGQLSRDSGSCLGFGRFQAASKNSSLLIGKSPALELRNSWSKLGIRVRATVQKDEVADVSRARCAGLR